jgi:hypothetical protein
VRLGTSEGALINLNSAEIDQRLPQRNSVMPDKLVDRLTAVEFRDLLSFLESLK